MQRLAKGDASCCWDKAAASIDAAALVFLGNGFLLMTKIPAEYTCAHRGKHWWIPRACCGTDARAHARSVRGAAQPRFGFVPDRPLRCVSWTADADGRSRLGALRTHELLAGLGSG